MILRKRGKVDWFADNWTLATNRVSFPRARRDWYGSRIVLHDRRRADVCTVAIYWSAIQMGERRRTEKCLGIVALSVRLPFGINSFAIVNRITRKSSAAELHLSRYCDCIEFARVNSELFCIISDLWGNMNYKKWNRRYIIYVSLQQTYP